MNASSASENGPYSTNPRPFFYAQASAPQQSFPNPWLLGPVYNPYGIPTAGLRSGNPYFPLYPVPLHEYPGYLVPQHPMHMRVQRRPYFNGHPSSPMFYQSTRFRHYNPGKRTETKETQTDVRQPESKPKKLQDHGIEVKGSEGGNMACVSSGVNKGAESALETRERTVSSPVSDRDFARSPTGSVQFCGLPPTGYAFEKEEVRIEYANGGAPAIQLWKSVKETIPLYDVAKKDNMVQRDMFALTSCEEVVYGSPEQGQLVPSISYPEEEKPLEEAQEKEPQSKVKTDSEKQGVPSYRGSSPVDEARATLLPDPAKPDQTKPDPVMSKRSFGLKRSIGSRAPRDVSNLLRQKELFPSGMEIMNDSYLPQKLNENSNVTNEAWAASETSLWCDESEKYIPSESWLACLDSLDANFNYDMYLSRRKRPSVLSVTSDDEMSSVDEEGSSTDNVPMSYLAPDYMLQKDMCTFKKSTEGLGRERIRSGGSLNEDEEVVGTEPSNLKRRSRIKAKELSCQSRKLGILPRASSSRHVLYPHKKKALRSLSPSEVDDSEEYLVKEPDNEEGEEEEEEEENEEREYLVSETAPYGTLNPGKGGPYWKTGQQVFWKLPKNAVPAHIISWPVQEKMKMAGPAATKLKKEQEQDELLYDDYNIFLKRPTAHQLEMFEHRRNSQKSSGRLQEESRRNALDEYWVKSVAPDECWTKSGARPKFASLMPGGLSPPTKSREKEMFPVASDNLYVEPPKKKKGVGKPPHKRRDTRSDAEVKEREKPKTAHHKGREAKRSLYKRR